MASRLSLRLPPGALPTAAAAVALWFAPAPARDLWVAGGAGTPWPDIAAQMDNLEAPGGWLQPVDVTGQNLAASAIDRGGWVKGTHFSEESLVRAINGVPEWGWGIRSLARELWQRDYVQGRDKQGNPRITDQFQDVTVLIDLGARFGVDSLSFQGYPGRPEWFVRAYQVFAHPGVPLIEPPPRTEFGVWVSWFPFVEDWPLLAEDDFVRAADGRVGRRVPLTQARYVALNDFISLPDPEGWEIDEFQVWGAGFVLSSRYETRVIDLGDTYNLGRLSWHADVPEGTRLSVRTRTGLTPEPFLYHERTGLGLTGQTEVTRARYERLRPNQQGDVAIDVQSWDEWSAPYEEVGSARLRARGPRRALQVAVAFDSDSPFLRPRLDSLAVEYSTDLLARQLVGEIEPNRVTPGEVSRLRYWLRAVVGPESAGFDALRVDTVAQVIPGSVRELRVGGEVASLAAAVDGAGFEVRFPEHRVAPQAGPDTVEVSVAFDALVYLHGTTFEGRVFDTRTQEVPQDVIPGDASPAAVGDGVGVAWPLDGRVIAGLRASSPVITPNGDGRNDELALSYSLLQLLTPVPIRLEVFDLRGRTVYAAQLRQGAGHFTTTWSGAGAGGQLVPPGLYLYRLQVSEERGGERHGGTVAVAY